MDDGFQQKKNRLDSLSSRLARGQAQARTATRDEPRKCKGCASDLAPGTAGDTCGSCAVPSSSDTPSNRRCCPECGLGVQKVSSFLTCSVCRKWIHAECDRSIEADPDDYTCARCRQSPIVGNDAMLGVGVDSPLADAEASNQGASNLGSLMGSMRSSPVAGSIGDESGRYSQRERRLSGSSESSSYSARNSPSFDPNACSEDDDFVPGMNRGGGSSRGGRGGKKKPGGRGGTLMKTRSGGKPPSGVFLDRLGKTERGKRGKGGGRGAGKAGSSSGKGRGGGAAASGRRTSTSGRVGGVVGGSSGTAAMTAAFLAAANSNPVLAAVLQHTMLQQTAQAASAAAKGKGKPARGAAEDAPSSSSAAVDNGRGEKEDEYVRTVVIVPEDDAFISAAPLCLVCGSVGRGTEQSMVACSGCAHSFHTYCVGLQEKMNATVRDRGWRCLDCTMCEGCGQNKDDSKLIMCEECDVAYHMYCLNPPLDRAPSGPWRCQWCAKCRRCGMRVTSSGELTKEGLCFPCLSLRKCPKCSKLYQINENIIRCSQCIKWYHGACEELHTEEMLESAALNKMSCSSCRPNGNRPFSSLNDGNIITCDNVALNKCADEVLKSKFMPPMFRANSFTDSSGGSSALAGLLGEFRSGGSLDSNCSYDGVVSCFDVETGEEWWRYDCSASVRGGLVAVGEFIYIGDYEGRLHKIDVAKRRPVWCTQVGGAMRAPPTVEGPRAATVSIQGATSVVDTETGAIIWRDEGRRRPNFASVLFLRTESRTKNRLVTVDVDGHVTMRNAGTGEEIKSISIDERVFTTPLQIESRIIVVTASDAEKSSSVLILDENLIPLKRIDFLSSTTVSIYHTPSIRNQSMIMMTSSGLMITVPLISLIDGDIDGRSVLSKRLLPSGGPPIFSPPRFVRDGVIVIGTRDDVVVSLMF